VNHFVGLLILSTCIATAFALLNRSSARSRVQYFLKLMVYMVIGSLVFAWIMYLIP